MCSVVSYGHHSMFASSLRCVIARMMYNSHMHVGADLIKGYSVFVEHAVLSILATNA